MAGTLFDIPGASAAKLEGTATAADVLSRKTFYNQDQRSKLTGTMPNNGAISKNITPTLNSQSYTIPPGYHPGTGKVTVEPIVGGAETKTHVGNGANHEQVNLDFNLPVKNKLHVCISSNQATGDFIIYGLKNGNYVKLYEAAFPNSYDAMSMTFDATGSYDGVRVYMNRTEIFAPTCRFVVTVATL